MQAEWGSDMSKKITKYILMLICIPMVILLGAVIFDDKQPAFISLMVVILSLIPVFLTFEKKNLGTRKLIIISVMTALSVIGRFIFAVVPGFKPVTAIVVITAMFFGGETGFLTGVLSAFISNFYFGQGPWTPFQMFAWGMLGLLAGLFSRPLKNSKICLVLYGVFAGMVYSFIMDIWTVLWYSSEFNLNMYLAALAATAPYTVTYCVSNVAFLLFLVKPIGDKLTRIRIKYGLS